MEASVEQAIRRVKAQDEHFVCRLNPNRAVATTAPAGQDNIGHAQTVQPVSP